MKGSVDDSVVERRLRPIYDWLDLGNTRKAIQECDKVLKKQPGLSCAKVLRCLALLRSGKAEDARQGIAQVVASKPTDDSSLQALTIYYREIHELDKICEVYEAAVKNQPKNEELLSHLFMSYVRVGNFKKQQQTAMTLYKVKPKNPYYFWAVISIVMQAKEEPEGSSDQRMCLTLAERMVEKFYKEGKLEAEAEVLAYLYVLELQKKYLDALEILDSDLREKITQQPANFVQLKRINYHLAQQQWQQAHAICKELIALQRDNWQHYESFCFSLIKIYQSSSDSNCDKSILEEGVSFLRDNLKDTESRHNTKYRAPFLALLELVWQMRAAGLEDLVVELGVRAEDEMLAYLSKFGSKWCAFSDVRRFLLLLPSDSVGVLVTKLKDCVNLDDKGLPIDVPALYRHLTWLQVKRCLMPDVNFTASDHLEEADKFLFMYNNCHHLACQTVATDIRRNDIYLLLSTHSVLSALSLLSAERPDSAEKMPSASLLVIKLAGILEAAIASSRANFQLKLLLLQLYNMIGACGACRVCYESLEIKSVQLDTLGNVLALQALDAGHYDLASSIFSTTNSFFVSAAKDTGEPMIQAYRYGSLTRIPEFREFRERLERSVHFATVTAEQMLLELTHSVSSHKAAVSVLEQQRIDPVADKTDYASLVCNTDKSVKIHWLPTPLPVPGSLYINTESLSSHASVGSTSERRGGAQPDAAVVEELKLRNVTLRLLGAGLQLTKHKETSTSPLTNGCSVSEVSSLQQYSDVLAELESLKLSSQSIADVEEERIDCSTLGTSRNVGCYARGSFVDCILRHGNLLLMLHNCCAGGKTAEVTYTRDTAQACKEGVNDLLVAATAGLRELHASAATAVLANTRALLLLHHALQTVGIITVMLGFCSAILRAVKRPGKKSKKKIDAPAQLECLEDFSWYITWLEAELGSLQPALQEKLSIAKENSRNSINLYSKIVPKFKNKDDQAFENSTASSDNNELESSVASLGLADRLTNGVEKEETKNEKYVPNETEGKEPLKDSLEPVLPDFTKTGLMIDASYQESLSNLKASLTAKLKYISTIKL
ncbi:N-alpha-acetyltransferase 25, NatB auxiliary subunit [Hyalella azteca]|uniref:N-terminal acetyltransferase B complex subunit MDM20 homolog n=1 Tax=Hyalella azteca TaxID=294128 RepID=A0A8B7PF42_HYAAZ|nr:N-alpha-acetyltransferase 25, NatB auxiliary subunit [Hyalella azteca]